MHKLFTSFRSNPLLSPEGVGGSGAGTESNSTEGAGTTPKTFTQSELDAVLSDRLKREREKFQDYADLKAKAGKLAEIEAGQLTEAQKLQALIDSMKTENATAKAETAKLKSEMLINKVLTELGLPATLASRIQGSSEEEMKADALALKGFLGITGSAVGGATNPGAQNQPKNIDGQIADAEAKGNWSLSLALKSQKFNQNF